MKEKMKKEDKLKKETDTKQTNRKSVRKETK